MKRIIYKFLFVAFLMTTISNLNAQNYNNAIGLRLGIYNGVTYRQFLNEKNAFEVYGTFRSYTFGGNLFTATGLYQYHSPIPDVEGLNWFAGGGATFWTTSGFNAFGITGVLGLDYTLASAPINFSLDWSPTFLLSEGSGFQGDYFALSVRYVLGRK
ncbi:MAG: hypothetical protein HC817_00825 [Saprospiraceae bacterium]|nr:hypothetical protein [Saprospiraceae bacterium]